MNPLCGFNLSRAHWILQNTPKLISVLSLFFDFFAITNGSVSVFKSNFLFQDKKNCHEHVFWREVTLTEPVGRLKKAVTNNASVFMGSSCDLVRGWFHLLTNVMNPNKCNSSYVCCVLLLLCLWEFYSVEGIITLTAADLDSVCEQLLRLLVLQVFWI